MSVKLLSGFAAICFSGVCQGVRFAARSESTACKTGILVMLCSDPGSHCMDFPFTFGPQTRTLKECFGSSESDGWREEKIFFSPVAKSFFQEWELEPFQGRSSTLPSGGVGLPCHFMIGELLRERTGLCAVVRSQLSALNATPYLFDSRHRR